LGLGGAVRCAIDLQEFTSGDDNDEDDYFELDALESKCSGYHLTQIMS
jgi:hypothetical protein